MSDRHLHIVDRGGPEDFSETLTFQSNLLTAKIEDRDVSDSLILVEHKEVFTTGRNTPQVANMEALPKEPKWIELSRGGQATYHGPGQLVAYPIFDLNHHGKDVHVFLRKLEQVGISLLEKYGLVGQRREGLTGLWVETSAGWRKIASMGIGVRKWVSYHGIAINLSADLRYFRAISPCGQPGEVMANIEDLLKAEGRAAPTLEELKTELVECFRSEFEFSERKRPKWMKAKAHSVQEFDNTKSVVRTNKLVTVCEEARCPNIGECWSHRTATFMIMGELCTRRCSFCSVKDGTQVNLDPLDPLEPYRVGRAVQELGLKHVVITSVNRDDVPDMGAEHFHKTVKSIRKLNPETKVELLIPDMRGRRELVESILKSHEVSVLNHNVETVPRLYKTVRPGAKFQRSLDILKWAKEISPSVKTKSGVMLGLGETKDEVLEVLDLLRESGVEIITLGQYLQPTEKQLPIARFITPREFEFFQKEGEARGFSFVESGALVRSSYHAWKHSDETGDELPYIQAGAE